MGKTHYVWFIHILPKTLQKVILATFPEPPKRFQKVSKNFLAPPKNKEKVSKNSPRRLLKHFLTTFGRLSVIKNGTDMHPGGGGRLGRAIFDPKSLQKCLKKCLKSFWGKFFETFSTFFGGAGEFFETFLKVFWRLWKSGQNGFLRVFSKMLINQM